MTYTPSSRKNPLRRSQLFTAEDPDLFRCVPPGRILEGFGRVFATGVQQVAAERRPSAKKDNAENDGIDHTLADEVFYSSSITESVDAFISHVWSSPRWQKSLAMLYFTNIRVATLGSISVWLAAGVGIMAHLLTHGSLEKNPLGGNQLVVHMLVYAPVATFYALFFCGHLIGAGHGLKLWLDKLCIHQSRPEVMTAGVSALPEFVSCSERMVILWSDTYFERLWCNMEIATFCATSGSSNGIEMQPLWLAPWLLTTLALDVVSISILGYTLAVIPICGEFFAKQFGADSTLTALLTQTVGIGIAIGVSYMPAVIPNYISFTAKIINHENMMKQIAAYRLEDAKCTVPTDRPIVEEQITDLFDANKELGFNEDYPHASAIDRFNYFVNTTFMDTMVDRVGLVTRLPYRIACLVFLPLMFMSTADVIYCDGAACPDSAVAEGYSSVTQYMFTNSCMWVLGNFLVVPTTYPVMLIGLSTIMSSCSAGILRSAACLAWIALAYFYMSFLFGFSAGLVFFAVVVGGYWIAICGMFLVVLIVWNVFLFGLPFKVTALLPRGLCQVQQEEKQLLVREGSTREMAKVTRYML